MGAGVLGQSLAAPQQARHTFTRLVWWARKCSASSARRCCSPERNIGYGVWFLRETVSQAPDQADTIRQTLRELLPHAADSLRLPSSGDASDLLGIKQDDLRTFALSGLTRRVARAPPGRSTCCAPRRGPRAACACLRGTRCSPTLSLAAVVFG